MDPNPSDLALGLAELAVDLEDMVPDSSEALHTDLTTLMATLTALISVSDFKGHVSTLRCVNMLM